MVFSSLLFVFLFLALNLMVYFFVSEKKRNYVLLIFSLIFYAWGGPKFLILLVGETAASWFFALQIEKEKADSIWLESVWCFWDFWDFLNIPCFSWRISRQLPDFQKKSPRLFFLSGFLFTPSSYCLM